jgi:hemoglobin
MKKDILNKKDIEKLVNLFYEKVKKDTIIGHFFNDDIKVNWDKHLQVMYNFWENVVFYTGSYNGNPMQKHFDIHAKFPLSMKDFNQWTTLFNDTVDELFEGENATLIKQRAQSIATIMQIKMFK